MATPKSRVSHARTHKRKSVWIGSAKGPELTTCPHCGEVIMNYRACGECGYYRGRKVMETAADAKAKE
ncbi:MAG: 50S ribosomal protein L32 [Synergistota bacterium]|jgi:large subunit ribosomal protein L32|nr:50S ribosomal protein L32 [Synergistota bacterium]OPZ39170.1 MAG: 50S ribosomal protein L32 [Synergistetes bacterium ADurb.BinA166]